VCVVGTQRTSLATVSELGGRPHSPNQNLTQKRRAPAQVRSTGPVNPLTKQPIKGRKFGGGIRFGEMERDALLAHGAAYLLHDRLHTASDCSVADVCAACGSLLTACAQPATAVLSAGYHPGGGGALWRPPGVRKHLMCLGRRVLPGRVPSAQSQQKRRCFAGPAAALCHTVFVWGTWGCWRQQVALALPELWKTHT